MLPHFLWASHASHNTSTYAQIWYYFITKGISDRTVNIPVNELMPNSDLCKILDIKPQLHIHAPNETAEWDQYCASTGLMGRGKCFVHVHSLQCIPFAVDKAVIISSSEIIRISMLSILTMDTLARFVALPPVRMIWLARSENHKVVFRCRANTTYLYTQSHTLSQTHKENDYQLNVSHNHHTSGIKL